MCSIGPDRYFTNRALKQVLLVLEEEPLDQPESHQDQPVGLGDGEGPGDSVHVVEELVGQRRVQGLVRHSLVDHGDDDGGEDEVEEGVEEGHACLPPLVGEEAGVLLLHADLDVVAAPLQLVAQGGDQLVLLQQAAQSGPLAPGFTVLSVRRRRRRRGGVAGRAAVSDPLRTSLCRGARRGHVGFDVNRNVVIFDQF